MIYGTTGEQQGQGRTAIYGKLIVVCPRLFTKTPLSVKKLDANAATIIAISSPTADSILTVYNVWLRGGL